jgi:DNA-binding MarR family transcriptional regulator
VALNEHEHHLTAEAIRSLLYRRDVAVARHRAAHARTLGVTDIEMLALVHLAEQGELAPSALANLLDLSSGGATALVQRLERNGHVGRKPHPTDGRSTLIRLTDETRERLEKAESPPYRALASLSAGLTEPERRIVHDVLAGLASLSEELEATSRRRAEPADDALMRPVPSLWA